jgi:hypothetical protein
MSAQATIAIMSQIFDQDVMLEIGFNFIFSGESADAPEITITSVSVRLAGFSPSGEQIQRRNTGGIHWGWPSICNYEPFGDVFEIHAALWPALRDYHKNDLLAAIGSYSIAAD